MNLGKLYTLLFFILLILLMLSSRGYSQARIPVEREILEYLYEQKKENDLRKSIISEKDTIIVELKDKVNILNQKIDTYKSDSITYKLIKQNNEQLISTLILTNKEKDEMIDKLKTYTKVTSGSTAILLIILLIIL